MVCSASDTVTIYVEDITIVDVPNAFSETMTVLMTCSLCTPIPWQIFMEFFHLQPVGQFVTLATNDPLFGWDRIQR